MTHTYVFRMIPGIGFHQDKNGSVLIRYGNQQDLTKLVNAFEQALDELKRLEAQPIATMPVIQNPLLHGGMMGTPMGNLNPVAAIGAATSAAAQHGNVAPLPAGHIIPQITPPEQLKPSMTPPGHQMPSVAQLIHRPILQQNSAPTIPVIASNNGVKVMEGAEVDDGELGEPPARI